MSQNSNRDEPTRRSSLESSDFELEWQIVLRAARSGRGGKRFTCFSFCSVLGLASSNCAKRSARASAIKSEYMAAVNQAVLCESWLVVRYGSRTGDSSNGASTQPTSVCTHKQKRKRKNTFARAAREGEGFTTQKIGTFVGATETGAKLRRDV